MTCAFKEGCQRCVMFSVLPICCPRSDEKAAQERCLSLGIVGLWLIPGSNSRALRTCRASSEGRTFLGAEDADGKPSCPPGGSGYTACTSEE